MDMDNVITTKDIGTFKISSGDNYFFAGSYTDGVDKPKGASFKYINKSIQFIDHSQVFSQHNVNYEYGFIIDNKGFRVGLFSFSGDKVRKEKSVNFEYNKKITILNGNNKAIIDNDNIAFFLRTAELKTFKHNCNLVIPKLINKLGDMKVIDEEMQTMEIVDDIPYLSVLESKDCTLYVNTPEFSKYEVESICDYVKIMLVSGKDKAFFMVPKFNSMKDQRISCNHYIYHFGQECLLIDSLNKDGFKLELTPCEYFLVDLRTRRERIRVFGAQATKIINGDKIVSHDVDEIYNRPKHSVNMADVTANTKIKYSDEFDSEAELNKLVGLEAAKKQIRRFKNTCLRSMKNGYPINLHMMFLGNPGTGKTTFARLVADIFYKNGILPTNKYIEGSRDTLVGQYTGETEDKTNAVFQSAMGGVLFIDEAYSLYRPATPNDFGNIAMAELIKLMEDYRGKICVIFAGYTKEMHDLLRINSGLKSRIQYEIQFDDYTKSELRQILDINLKKDNYILDDDGANLIIDFIDKKRGSLSFANAREVRTALEQLTMIQAERTFKTNIDDREISVMDVAKYISENTYKKDEIHIPLQEMIKMDYLKKCSEISLDLDKDYERIIESVMELELYSQSGNGTSSAFLISPDGYAITAAHSVRDAYKIDARRRILDRVHNVVETYHKCYVCGYDNKSDIAIIKIENQFKNEYPYLPLYLGKEYMPIFTEILVFGYPLGTNIYDNLSGFKGYISSVQVDQNNVSTYNLDVISMPGLSGACVIDRKTMKVVGIINGLKSVQGHGIPYGCPIQEAIKLVEGGESNE